MTDYVKLDNLPTAANHLLNILWDRNHEMSLAELMDAVNSDFAAEWNKHEIRMFVRYLLHADYVEEKRHGLKVNYAALGLYYDQ